MSKDQPKNKRAYVYRNCTHEQRSEINRRTAIAQWAKKKILRHSWRTIRVHEEVWQKLHDEFAARNGGRTMHGVPNEIELDWSKFLLGLFEDSKALKNCIGATRKVCEPKRGDAPKKVNHPAKKK